jgi:hypothetical protein
MFQSVLELLSCLFCEGRELIAYSSMDYLPFHCYPDILEKENFLIINVNKRIIVYNTCKILMYG